jgi:hypothetical protein
MILLTDLVVIPEPENTWVKLHAHHSDYPNRPAWDLLLDDDPLWDSMNRWRQRRQTLPPYLFTFAQYYPYGSGYFIFGGLYKVPPNEPQDFDAAGDLQKPLELLTLNQQYVKRLIVKTKKLPGRIWYMKYQTFIESYEPEVYEIAPDVKLGHFPGYQNVSLRYPDLRRIFDHDEPSWKSALSNVKGNYVITDTNTGKLYVGSASGSTDGIWQRWQNYANPANLHGDNKELKEIVATKGRQYIKDHFRYSIIEIFDTKTKQETIIERENYWKRALDTIVPHGLNYS